MFEEKRGRPRGRLPLNYEYIQSIVLIARKHDLNPKRLADSFLEAWENEISHYGGLEISCREVNHDSAIFLIMKGEKVIWQSSLRLEVVRDPDIKEYLERIPIHAGATKKKYHKDQKIGELKFGMKGINVRAEIIEAPPARNVITRFGTTATVSNIIIADETGSVRFGLWNDQIHKFQKNWQIMGITKF